MYLPTVAFQTKIFFLSIGLGFLLGILYDIFYLFRITFTRTKIALYVQDILYLLICSFVTFLYILSVSSGMIRLYILIGEIFGFFIYYISVGYFIVSYATKAIKKTKRITRKFFLLLIRPIKCLNSKIARKFRKSSSKIINKNKKNIKRFKLCLKFRRKLLYNTVNMVDDVVSQERNEGIEQKKT